MKNKDKIIGKHVLLYLSGGWQITGRVEVFNDDRIILKSDGNLSVVFMDKIACMTVVDSPVDREGAPAYDDAVVSVKPEPADESFPMNGMNYSDTPFYLPTSLVGMKDEDEDFSVFFAPSDESKKRNSGIKFGVEGDFEEEDREAESQGKGGLPFLRR